LTSQGIFRTFSPYDREPRRLLGDMLVLRGDRATGVTAPAGRSAAATTLSPPGLVLEPGDPAASAGAAPAVATVGGKGGALGPLSRATPRLPPGRAVAPDSAPAADSVAAGLGEAEEGLRGGGGGGDLDARRPDGGAAGATGPPAAPAPAPAPAPAAPAPGEAAAVAAARLEAGRGDGAERVGARDARRPGLGDSTVVVVVPGGSSSESTARRRSASMPGSTAPRAVGSRSSCW
jgi:hypothetical protein